MGIQEPSVLIRVPGKTRDLLLALRRKANEWSSYRMESLGDVVTRLATDAAKKEKKAGA